jgi:hypothetical protein
MNEIKHNSSDTAKPQAEKFADLARELECDESEEAFDERLRVVAGSFKNVPGRWTVEPVKDGGYKARFIPSSDGSERNVTGFATEKEAADWVLSNRHAPPVVQSPSE